MPNHNNHRNDALKIFNTAVTAVHPAQLLKQHIAITGGTLTICDDIYPAGSTPNIYVIGAGKASAAMAVETEKILGDLVTGGLVVTKKGHAMPSAKINIIQAAHPVPDESCMRAVSQTLALLKNVRPNDIVICLISGGASSLWCDVPEGLTLDELKTSFELLIRSGAAIHEINCIRKHLSGIKGGQLVSYCNGAKVYALIISDVPGDDPGIIASGPTVAGNSTFEDAYQSVLKYKLQKKLPANVIAHLEKGMNGVIPGIQQSDTVFNRVCNRIIGNNGMAVSAAANTAAALGYTTHIITAPVTGDVEAEAKKLVKLTLLHQNKKPYCIIQGGETTIKVTGNGKGGRNQHFALAALIELSKTGWQNNTEITIVSGGTDGTDGITNATGGIADSYTLQLAKEKHLSASEYLTNHNSYHYLEQTDSLIITGPTQTNVMDIMIALIN